MAEKKQIFCKLCETNGVKTEIVFNPTITRVRKSDNKKVQIPLDSKTKQPHDCPFFKGNKSNGAGQPPKTAGKKQVTISKIAYITPLVKSASIEGIVCEVSDPTNFNKQDGTTGLVAHALIGDDSGEIRLTLWNEDVDKLKVGDRIRLENGYVTVYQEKAQISIGKFGKLIVNPALKAEKKEESDTEDIPTL